MKRFLFSAICLLSPCFCLGQLGALHDSPNSPHRSYSITAGQANGLAKIVYRLNGGLEISASAPIDEDQPSTEVTDLDGLANKGKLALRQYWYVRLAKGPDNDYFADQLEATCLEELAAEVEEKCADVDSISTFEEVMRGNGVGDGKILRLLRKEYQRDYPSWFAPYIEGQVAHKDYEYFHEDGKKHKVGRLSEGVAGGVLWSWRPWAWVQAEFERQWNNKAPEVMAQVCAEIEGSEFDDCRSLPFGAPVEEDRETLRIGGAYLHARVAVRPLLSYEFEEDVFGAEFPIYFLLDENRRFVGGVQLGWRSDNEEDFPVSVFVSTPLTLFF